MHQSLTERGAVTVHTRVADRAGVTSTRRTGRAETVVEHMIGHAIHAQDRLRHPGCCIERVLRRIPLRARGEKDG